jgi:hypothetical protein
MKPPHQHAKPQYDEVECGWCEHHKWETFRRTMDLHDMSFNRYVIEEEPF